MQAGKNELFENSEDPAHQGEKITRGADVLPPDSLVCC